MSTYITPNRTLFNKDIQKCINYAIEKHIPTVFIPKGYWDLEHLVLQDPNAPGSQVSITIVGEDCAYGNKPSQTTLRFHNTSGAAIGIQTGKGVNIRNLQLVGPNQLNYSIEQTCTPGTNFVKAGIENSRYNPHAGICFDPNVGKGSTDCSIENVSIDGFVNGIVYTPHNGPMWNGDCMSVDRVWIANALTGVAQGQSQTRGNVVRNLKAWNSVRTVFDCFSYGHGFGALPVVYGGCMVGVYELFNSHNAWGMGSFNDVYCESIYRIGDAGGGELPTNFNNCHFDFMLGMKEYPENLATGANLNFNGGVMRYYDDTNDWRPMNFNAGTYVRRPISFNNVYMNNPPSFGNDADFDENFVINNCIFKNGADLAATGSWPKTYKTPFFTQKWIEYYTSGSGTVYNDGVITFDSELTYEIGQPVISRHGVVGVVDTIEGKKITLKYCVKVPDGTQVGNQIPITLS